MLRGKAAVSQEYPLSFHWEILFNGLDRVVTNLRNFKLTVCPIREDSCVYPAAVSQHVEARAFCCTEIAQITALGPVLSYINTHIQSRPHIQA